MSEVDEAVRDLENDHLGDGVLLSKLAEVGCKVYVFPAGGLPLSESPILAWRLFVRSPSGKVFRFLLSRHDLRVVMQAVDEGICLLLRRRVANYEHDAPQYFGLLSLRRPLVMGIINVTPDSFSDGGENIDPVHAVARGRAMVSAGADILDIGGESTRPGAAPVAPEEEIRRVIPVIQALLPLGVPLSVDTRHSAVMRAAVAAGVSIVNDVTALSGDLLSLKAVSELRVPVVLMHMQGDPRTMQHAPSYQQCCLDVFDALEARVEACVAMGIPRSDICVDPGIGFGKTMSHNADILTHLSLYRGLGCAVLLGASRKSFVGHVSHVVDPKGRVSGSLALAVAGWERGVHIVRVHDVTQTIQARDTWHAVYAPAERA